MEVRVEEGNPLQDCLWAILLGLPLWLAILGAALLLVRWVAR